MAPDDSSVLVVGIAIVVALVGIGLATSSVASYQSFGGMMGGGMMGGAGTSGPGVLERGVLLASAALLVVAVLVYVRSRSGPGVSVSGPPPSVAPGPIEPSRATVPPTTPEPPVPELTIVRLLDEDERRMYIEIRNHAGEMLQRDLVALGTFSKAKVTRVLDKLERKGLVVRERHGMTNRVRIVTRAMQ